MLVLAGRGRGTKIKNLLTYPVRRFSISTLNSRKNLLLRLFALNRMNGNVGFVVCTFLEFYHAVAKGENGMIFTETNIESGFVNGATLSDDDIAGLGELSAIDFHAETFAV
jgi:hypothetical protein